mgnify:CR=1 FL=1
MFDGSSWVMNTATTSSTYTANLTGALLAWIDVGAPDAARLHKAAKAAPRVAVYSHRAPEQLRALKTRDGMACSSCPEATG